MIREPALGASIHRFRRAAAIGAWTAFFAARSAAELAVVACRGDRAAVYRRFGHLLSLYLERLGPTFVKFGQAISTPNGLSAPGGAGRPAAVAGARVTGRI